MGLEGQRWRDGDEKDGGRDRHRRTRMEGTDGGPVVAGGLGQEERGRQGTDRGRRAGKKDKSRQEAQEHGDGCALAAGSHLQVWLTQLDQEAPGQVRVGRRCRTLPQLRLLLGAPVASLPLCLSLQAAMDGAPPAASPAGLSVYVAVSQVLGVTLLATTGAWLGRYRGGVAWHSPLQFNAHPLCMVLGMVFLQGDGEQDGGTPALCQLQPPEPGAALGWGMKGTKATGKVCQHLWVTPVDAAVPSLCSSAGVPGVQARSQALHQGPARPAPWPGAAHRPPG